MMDLIAAFMLPVIKKISWVLVTDLKNTGQLLASGFLHWLVYEINCREATTQIGVIIFECQLIESFGGLRNHYNFQLSHIAKG